MYMGKLADFISEISSLVDKERIVENTINYEKNTLAYNTKSAYAIEIKSEQELVEAVKLANLHKVKVQAVSSCRNWGYGSFTNKHPDIVLLDLSLMNKIKDVDEKACTVTLQAGATQGQLSKLLDMMDSKLMVPTTGAGTDTSIVSNLLEKGFGFCPISDHFSALLSVRAVLPDGSIYTGPFSEIDKNLDKNSSWGGIGAFIPGLFLQSNLGIVTEATIELAPYHKDCEVSLINIKEGANFDSFLNRIKEIKNAVPGVIGAFYFANAKRAIATFDAKYKELLKKGPISKEELDRVFADLKTSPWICLNMVLGPKAIRKTAKQYIRKELSEFVDSIEFYDQKKINFIHRLSKIFPFFFNELMKMKIDSFKDSFALFAGRSRSSALQLAYLRNPLLDFKDSETKNPARDDCGIIWYAPILSFDQDIISKFEILIEEVCNKHNIPPLIAFTIHNSRYLIATIPITFNQDAGTKEAHACYQELVDRGIKELKIHPYRLTVESMRDLIDENHPHWQLVNKLKDSLDPNRILAPGRYCLEEAQKALN